MKYFDFVFVLKITFIQNGIQNRTSRNRNKAEQNLLFNSKLVSDFPSWRIQKLLIEYQDRVKPYYEISKSFYARGKDFPR